MLRSSSRRPGARRSLRPCRQLLWIASRPVRLISRHFASSEARDEDSSFAVMSYNVLSHRETSSLTYCKPEILDPTTRRENLILEIDAQRADLIALQELDHKDFDERYSEHYRRHYETLYFPGGREKHYVHDMDRTNAHGVALFFHKDKFRVKDSFTLDYRLALHEMQPALIHAKFTKRLKILVNVALVAHVVHLPTGRSFYAANTHLYWHPSFDAARIVQLKLLTQLVERVAAQSDATETPATIICGDFNSQPNSAPYKFLREGRVSSLSDALLFEREQTLWGDVTHSLDLRSTYAETIGEPEFTNFTPGFKGTLDYIWFTPSSLTAVRSKPLMSEAEAAKETALPSTVCPSDHLPLHSVLRFN